MASAHCDGTYRTDDREEMSFYTLHLYLNESDPSDGEEQLKGGATTFHDHSGMTRTVDVNPKIGRVLIFQHRDLLHSGADVVNGTKYTMRTDLMYRRRIDD